jgi:hypothetical protein
MQAINTGTVLYAPILEFIVDACIFAHMGRLLSILKNRKKGEASLHLSSGASPLCVE